MVLKSNTKTQISGEITDNIVRGICPFRLVDLKEVTMNMNSFKRSNAQKKWHDKAWLVNPNKTKIVLVANAGPKRKHVPPWIFRQLDNSASER